MGGAFFQYTRVAQQNFFAAPRPGAIAVSGLERAVRMAGNFRRGDVRDAIILKFGERRRLGRGVMRADLLTDVAAENIMIFRDDGGFSGGQIAFFLCDVRFATRPNKSFRRQRLTGAKAATTSALQTCFLQRFARRQRKRRDKPADHGVGAVAIINERLVPAEKAQPREIRQGSIRKRRRVDKREEIGIGKMRLKAGL